MLSATPGAGAPPPEVDWIVVGGGSAGCVLARRLAEDGDASVLLTEAGPGDEGVAELADPGAWPSLLGGRWDWGLCYEPGPEVHGRSIPIPRGRVLGGSSSINAMLWYRGHPADYDAWAAAGATGWDFEALLPWFRRSEDWEGGASARRGVGGPMRVETPRQPHPVAAALLEAAAELGLPVIADANAADNEGATLANLNQRAGADGTVSRWGASRGYLRPAVGWPNLTVLTGSPVAELGFDGQRCRRVRHPVRSVPGGWRWTTARRGVVLTLGAIHTPELLLRSGIGDPDELRRLGIPVRSALRGVGRNFQDHPLLRGVNLAARTPLGPVRDNGGGAMVNWRSSAAVTAGTGPDLHAFVVQGPHVGPDVPGARETELGDGRVFAVSPGLMRSRSVGSVRLRSADPADGLAIQPNFLREPADLEALVESIDLVMELVTTAPYRSLVAGPRLPARRLRTRAEKVDFVRRSCDTFFHCCGSARMGTDEDAVVDPGLAVRGVEGLWVADASVIPVIPTCNTQAPVIAIAERAAHLLRTG